MPTVFSPDGSLVAYSVPYRGTFLWSVESRSVVSTNLVGPCTRLAVSPNNELIAALVSAPPSLRAIDRLSNSNWQITRWVAPAERAGVHFSGDSRFLVYAASPAPNQTVQVLIYDFQTGASNLISQSFDGLTRAMRIRILQSSALMADMLSTVVWRATSLQALKTIARPIFSNLIGRWAPRRC